MCQSVTLCLCGSTQESNLMLFIAVAKMVTEVTLIVVVANKMIVITVTVEV